MEQNSSIFMKKVEFIPYYPKILCLKKLTENFKNCVNINKKWGTELSFTSHSDWTLAFKAVQYKYFTVGKKSQIRQKPRDI